ncbi:hypothetical protein ACJWDR_43550 [Streptomyces tauricus]|uniref:hypothetical protein n=1 Tax=Streptomyces tauricus TaxID=68274 RepID=UPI00387F08FB
MRCVADEEIGGRPVAIVVSVCRLYCENTACSRTTFVEQVEQTEQVEELTEPYQRRAPALRRLVEAVTVVLAGSPGARLLTVLHQRVSPTSVSNPLMLIPLSNRPTPAIAGIGEFALLKGHRYATIIACGDRRAR